MPKSSIFQYSVVNYNDLSVIETSIGHREIELNMVYFLRFCTKWKVSYMIFKIPYWTYTGSAFDKCHKKQCR